ncbi:hypothetical protein [Luteolibacter sp. Populi]|uniref:hypothetical protein n=1 Tax=Luteolibacter sp. Populi TaxID=3230487 RepID=UPI0034654DE7
MELSANETYTEALDFFHDDPEQSLMMAIRAGHDENVDCLSDHLVARGGDLNPDAEAREFFSKAVEGVSCTFGETATLLALEAGETGAMKEYRRAMEDPELPPGLREDIRGRIMPRLRRHIEELERLRSAQAAEAALAPGS